MCQERSLLRTSLDLDQIEGKQLEIPQYSSEDVIDRAGSLSSMNIYMNYITWKKSQKCLAAPQFYVLLFEL